MKATSFFLGGVFVVLIGWPIIGVVLEVYGFFLLFRWEDIKGAQAEKQTVCTITRLELWSAQAVSPCILGSQTDLTWPHICIQMVLTHHLSYTNEKPLEVLIMLIKQRECLCHVTILMLATNHLWLYRFRCSVKDAFHHFYMLKSICYG